MSHHYKVWENVKIQDLVGKKRPVIHVDAKTSILDALRSIRENHFLSFPVYDSAAKEYIGLLNIFDIVCYVATSEQMKKTLEQPVESVVGYNQESAQVRCVLACVCLCCVTVRYPHTI